jgi:hypothetical protein
MDYTRRARNSSARGERQDSTAEETDDFIQGLKAFVIRDL